MPNYLCTSAHSIVNSTVVLRRLHTKIFYLWDACDFSSPVRVWPGGHDTWLYAVAPVTPLTVQVRLATSGSCSCMLKYVISHWLPTHELHVAKPDTSLLGIELWILPVVDSSFKLQLSTLWCCFIGIKHLLNGTKYCCIWLWRILTFLFFSGNYFYHFAYVLDETERL